MKNILRYKINYTYGGSNNCISINCNNNKQLVTEFYNPANKDAKKNFTK